jgi:hypothetical protein
MTSSTVLNDAYTVTGWPRERINAGQEKLGGDIKLRILA